MQCTFAALLLLEKTLSEWYCGDRAIAILEGRGAGRQGEVRGGARPAALGLKCFSATMLIRDSTLPDECLGIRGGGRGAGAHPSSRAVRMDVRPAPLSCDCENWTLRCNASCSAAGAAHVAPACRALSGGSVRRIATAMTQATDAHPGGSGPAHLGRGRCDGGGRDGQRQDGRLCTAGAAGVGAVGGPGLT